ncbi:MAG: hypothetical protein ABJB16_16685, partial [Saprospiraceae bacterium]
DADYAEIISKLLTQRVFDINHENQDNHEDLCSLIFLLIAYCQLHIVFRRRLRRDYFKIINAKSIRNQS